MNSDMIDPVSRIYIIVVSTCEAYDESEGLVEGEAFVEGRRFGGVEVYIEKVFAAEVEGS